jgi:hypothetical protein
VIDAGHSTRSPSGSPLVLYGFDGKAARNLSTGVSAHAIGDGE